MPVAITNPALSTLAGLLAFDLQIDGEALNLTSSEVSSVGVTNQEGQHESALITTQVTKTQLAKFVNGLVSFSYGPKTNSNTFYGYVVSITPNQNYQTDTIVDITCVGVTFPLQNGTPKFVKDITAPDMFAAMLTGGFRQDVSTGYNLGAQVDTHSYVWPYLAQTDESDWAYLLTLAERIGYAVYTYKGGLVRMVKPLRVYTETPIFASFIKGDQILDQTRTLLDWQATTQSLDVRQNVKPSFGFFDGTAPATTQTSTSAGPQSAFPAGSPPDPLIPAVPVIPSNNQAANANLISPYRVRSDTPVKDRFMADSYSQAWLDRIDFWNEQASARINGNANLYPGMNISVQVSGVQNGVNDYDGVWLVRGVTHQITHSSFQTQLDLARDTTVTPVNTQANWFWNVPRGSPKVTLDPVTNKWKSSWGSAPEFIRNTLAVAS